MTIQERIAALATVTSKLNESDTRISELIKEIETALRSVLSTRVSTPLGTEVMLVYGKLGGVWRLLVEADPTAEPRPLASMPRDVRADAFASGAVEQLLADAVGQVELMMASRRIAVVVAERIVNAIRLTPGACGDKVDT